MFDFILQGSRTHERALTTTVQIATDEIKTRFVEDWQKVESAKRCNDTIALSLRKAAQGAGDKPRVLLTIAPTSKKSEFDAIPPGAPVNAEEVIHFLQVGEAVFPIMARDPSNKNSSLLLYPPVERALFEKKKEAVAKEGMKPLYGKTRSELDVIKLERDRGPTTSVQFNDAKVYEDQSYGWALWELAASLLRRGHTTALREAGLVDSLEASSSLGKTALKKGPISTFKEALPFLVQKKGKVEADGPPRGQHLLYAFSWETDEGAKPVAITRDEGVDGRIHAFVRDRIGDRPAWLELPFPKNAKIPAAGISATLEGDVLRIFGGVDASGKGLTGEWFYELPRGYSSAYAHETFRVGDTLPDARAWAAAIATDTGTMLAGGVAGFIVQQGKDQKFAAVVRDAIEQARRGQKSWAEREPVSRDLAGASVMVEENLAYVGPGSTFDGAVDLFDGRSAKWTPLEDLPGGYGLGQLHRAGNLLFYTGGFFAPDGQKAVPSGKIFALDLEQLDGWQEIGESDFLKGGTRLVARDDTLVAMTVTPKGRMTFVPGVFGEEAA